MKDEPQYTELALLIQPIGKTEHYSSPSASWVIEFVSVDQAKMQPVNISDWYDYAQAIRGFQDLQIRTHLWATDKAAENNFSYDLKYSQIHSAGLRDIERRFKALSSLERKWLKVREQYGAPQSIGEYVGQIMLAAGIKQSFEAKAADAQEYSGYDNAKWRRRDVAGTRSRIMQLRYEWFEKHQPKEPEVDADANAA